MTGSDLCSASKPWDAQEQTAEIIYAEFYEQVWKRTTVPDPSKSINQHNTN